MMARGTWQKERDRFYLYRRGTLFDAKALLQWGETNRARVGAGQEPLPLPSELEPYKKREAAKPIAWAAAGAGVAAAVIAGGYYGIKSRGRRSNPATRRPKPRGLAPLVSGPSRRRPTAKKTNPRRKAKRANPRRRPTPAARYLDQLARYWKQKRKPLVGAEPNRDGSVFYYYRDDPRSAADLVIRWSETDPEQVGVFLYYDDEVTSNKERWFKLGTPPAKLWEFANKKTNPRRKAKRANPRPKGWIGKVDREMTADDTEGDFTAQARRAGYANTLTYARAVMRGWRSGKKTVLNKKRRRQQGITLRTMRRANFALNAQKRKRNPAPKKKNPRKATPRLTAAQARALSDYIRWAGPKWQTKLRGDWMRAGSEWPGEWAHLQQLRNKLGTTTAAAQALVDAKKRSPKKKNPRKAKRETKAAWIKRMTGPRRGKKSLTRKQAEGLWKGAHTKKRAAA